MVLCTALLALTARDAHFKLTSITCTTTRALL